MTTYTFSSGRDNWERHIAERARCKQGPDRWRVSCFTAQFKHPAVEEAAAAAVTSAGTYGS